MRYFLYVPLLVTPMLIMTGCSIGHQSREDGDGHHLEDTNQPSHGNADNHDNAEGDHHESSIGKPGDVNSVDRVISVVMDDTMRFIPDSFDVIAGETIQFDVVNKGKLVHEFVLGSTDELMEHQAMMKKMPGMGHDESNSVSLETNASGSVIWSFTNTGVVDIACLKAGHFEAGMKGTVAVSGK